MKKRASSSSSSSSPAPATSATAATTAVAASSPPATTKQANRKRRSAEIHPADAPRMLSKPRASTGSVAYATASGGTVSVAVQTEPLDVPCCEHCPEAIDHRILSLCEYAGLSAAASASEDDDDQAAEVVREESPKKKPKRAPPAETIRDKQAKKRKATPKSRSATEEEEEVKSAPPVAASLLDDIILLDDDIEILHDGTEEPAAKSPTVVASPATSSADSSAISTPSTDDADADDLTPCPICAKLIRSAKLETHAQRCYPPDECGTCPHCRNVLPLDRLVDHQKRCSESRAERLADQQMAIEHSRAELPTSLVNATQLRALEHVRKQAVALSKAAESTLWSRLAALGFTKEDETSLLEYIRLRAPLIIHVNMNRVDDFLKDTHYRNRFEVLTSGGSTSYDARAGWEKSIFGGAYEKAKPVERPKYGALSFLNSPFGCLSTCFPYGDSFFVLNNERVRLRTTFASCDTSSAGVQMATCEHCCHILTTFTDPELNEVVRVSKGEHVVADSSRMTIYKEIQIAGMVDFSRDFSALVVNHRHQADPAQLKKIEEFCNKNNIAMVPMEKDTVYRGAPPCLAKGSIVERARK
jgi:hypothetical protein